MVAGRFKLGPTIGAFQRIDMGFDLLGHTPLYQRDALICPIGNVLNSLLGGLQYAFHSVG